VGSHRLSVQRKHGRAQTAIAAFAATICIVGLTNVVTAQASAQTPSAASDSFARTLVSGLGAANLGGSYSLGYAGPNPFSVADGAAQVTALSPGNSVSASLMDVKAADVDVKSTLVLSRVRNGSGLYHGVEARRSGDSSAYRGRMTVGSGGHAYVSLARSVAGRETFLTLAAIPTVVTAGQQIAVEMQVTGVNPVALQVRAWPAGGGVPDWQLVYNDNSDARITSAGGIGIWDYLSSSASPTSFAVRDLSATPLNLAPTSSVSAPISISTAPPAVTSPPPLTSSSTSTPTSTSAGTTPSVYSSSSSTLGAGNTAPGTTSTAQPPATTAPLTTPPTGRTTSSSTATVSSQSGPAPATTIVIGSATSSAVAAPTTAMVPTAPTMTAAPPITTAPNTTTPPPAPPSQTGDRGSMAVGSANYAIPGNALFVSPSGDDGSPGTIASPLRTVATALSRAAANRTIVLRGGTYHESVFIPDALAGLVIQPYPGEAAWFDGSTQVTNWSRSGSTWVSTGYNYDFDTSASFDSGSDAGGFVNSSYPMAAHPDQLFIDGKQLIQVASTGQVNADSFYVDTAGNRLIMGANPSGHDVRTSDLQKAIVVSAPNVTLQGFGVRRYATSLPQMGTVYLARSGDALRNMVLSDSATQAVGLWSGRFIIDHVTISNSGMTGISGAQVDGTSITNSLITNTNTEHFNGEPAGAAVKITRSRGITVTNNDFSNGRNVMGLWFDESVVGFTVTRNTMTNNGSEPNIQAELSDTGIIADNVLTDSSAGVLLFDSGNINVYNNTFGNNGLGSVFLNQDERRESTPGNNHDPRQPIPDSTCPWLLRNITIANNAFGWNGGPYGFQVYVLDKATGIPANSMNITIAGNAFHPKGSTTDNMVGWGGNDNHTLTLFQTPSALASGLGKSWDNVQVPVIGTALAMAIGPLFDHAVPLPSDLAALIGQPAGTKRIGSF